MTVFVGGSKTISGLNAETISALNAICKAEDKIVIGDCFGADKLVQEYLAKRQYANVEIYISGENTRNNLGGFPEKHIPAEGMSGFQFYRRKDIAMAKDADIGLMLWDGKTRGTFCNIEDMRTMGKEVRVIMYKGE
ncbi:adenine-specific DNA-methyltransferase [Ruminococcus sp. YRD2003]|uniref:hypothetical protein n=1 Tax=Ruminococcus sp. YRD2003 TaxID=1452313 RepID=UPI0008C9DD11|nr:adenine-specific DNA-methyltransferase [Ruminococcus flavefaciens]